MKNETLEALYKVAIIDKALPLGTMAEEEASELIQGLCKLRRGKGNINNIIEEAIDTIGGAMLLLIHLDVKWYEIETGILRKMQRTLHRHAETGEL